MAGEGSTVEPTVVTSIDGLPPEYQITAKDALARVDALAKAGRLRDFAAPGTNGEGQEAKLPDAPPFVPDYRTWKIGETTYELRSPVILQEKQLIALGRKCKGGFRVELDGANLKLSAKKAAEAVFSIDNWLSVFSASIGELFAILLVPVGVKVIDKDVAATQAELEAEMTLTDQAEVLHDFFVYTGGAAHLLRPQMESMVSSVVQSIRAAWGKVDKKA